MPISPILTDLDAKVTKATTVMASGTTLIRGIGARISEAVTAALANGATAEELAPVTALATALETSSNDMAAAISENTPAAGQPA